MKLYSHKYHRSVERQIHFGVGQSTRTACGLVLFSRHVIVSVFSDSDGAIITDSLERVTCKRCLAAKATRLHKLIAVERVVPGIFDRDSLCGEKWLLDHALTVSKEITDKAKLKISVGEKHLVLSTETKGRRQLIRAFIQKGESA